jgi:hypothetical protein
MTARNGADALSPTVERPAGGDGDPHDIEIARTRGAHHGLASSLCRAYAHDAASPVPGQRDFVDDRDRAGPRRSSSAACSAA